MSKQTPFPQRTLRVRCFLHANLWFTRVGKLVTALHEGFWLGCLTADDFNAITADHFDASQFYKSTEHNLSGFLPWEAPLVERYFQGRSRVLVAGAGAGREILALRKAGYKAEGFECSLSLIHAGRELFARLGEPYEIVGCAPDSVPPGSGDYDAVILGWGAYTHIPTRARRIAFLRGLKERSVTGSPMVISFFTRNDPSVLDKIVDRTAAVVRFVLSSRKEGLEPGDRIEWSRYVHRFTREELEAELEEGGFLPPYYGQGSDFSGHAVAFGK